MKAISVFLFSTLFLFLYAAPSGLAQSGTQRSIAVTDTAGAVRPIEPIQTERAIFQDTEDTVEFGRIIGSHRLPLLEIRRRTR